MVGQAQMIGADAEALAAAANSLTTAADELDASAHSLTSALGGLQWLGSVAVRFSDVWNSGHHPNLAKTAGFLREAADLLRQQAAEQLTASAAGSSQRSIVGPSGSIGSGRLDALVSQASNLGSPAEVRAWWDSLTDAERAALKAERPELVGNLDGVPPADRYAANRLNIQNHIDELKAQGASPGEIARFQSFLDGDRQILLFDPTGDGRIAEVFGNLATADDVAVVVPGIGNSLASYSDKYARNLHDAANGDTATIMWLGYDTPSAPKDLNLLDPSAISAARAKEWAPSLASFTDGLRATGYGEITVVAHSYGTVLAAEAAKVGMHVERVILLGSPGIPAGNASVFNGADVFAAKNSGEYVDKFSTHGTDPTSDGFGARHLPGNPLKLFDHESYFNKDSQALEGIVKAVEGSRSGPDGMVVHRYVHADGSAEDIATGTF